jgi:hypothetical protein
MAAWNAPLAKTRSRPDQIITEHVVRRLPAEFSPDRADLALMLALASAAVIALAASFVLEGSAFWTGLSDFVRQVLS